MRIRFVLMNGYGVGGTIRTTFTTAAELAKRHDVEVVSVYRRRDVPELPLPDGVRFRALTDLRGLPAGRPWRSWAARRASRLMSQHDFRHPNFNLLTDVNLLRYLLSLRDGVVIGTRPAINLAIARVVSPSVVRVGQDHMNLRSYNLGLKAQIAAIYPRLDLLSSLTEGDADDYRRHLTGRVRVACVPNGVPETSEHRSTLEDKVVVAAGRIGRQKGFDRLLPVWAQVARQHPNWELRIFGDGKGIGKLRRQIDDLGVADSARMMGFTPRLSEELSHASLFVLSSRKEGFPMVLLEAMAVGLPVVSYDCPTGPRDIVRDGVDGYVVPDGDGDALAAAIGRLLVDPDQRKRFGTAALERTADYDIRRIAAVWEALLSDLEAGKDQHARRLAGSVVTRVRQQVSRRTRSR